MDMDEEVTIRTPPSLPSFFKLLSSLQSTSPSLQTELLIWDARKGIRQGFGAGCEAETEQGELVLPRKNPRKYLEERVKGGGCCFLG